MTMELFGSVNFKSLYRDAKKRIPTITPALQRYRDEDIIIDTYPECLIKDKNPKVANKKLIAFCKDLEPVISHLQEIQFCKYPSGKFNGYELDEEDISPEDWKKFAKEDEEKYFAKNLETLLKKHSLIKSSTKISVHNITKSCPTNFAFGYQITFNDTVKHKTKHLFAKVFNLNERFQYEHGIIPEISRHIYINHNMPPEKNFPHFYFGIIKTPVLFSEFIEKDKHFDKHIYPDSVLGLDFSDHYAEYNHNYIGAYRIDAGGILPINSIAVNKVARGIAKRIYRTPRNERLKLWEKLFDMPAANKGDVVAGLVHAIELLPEKRQKKCYCRILESEYMNEKPVKVAILSRPEFGELIRPIKKNIDFFEKEISNAIDTNDFSFDEINCIRCAMQKYSPS